ncbi:FUSC family protein [Blautia schinkii]|nr:FUSC family protein [Blautia schinkii]
MNQQGIISEKPGITILDIRIAAAVAICCITSTILNHFGLKLTYVEMHLEIIQKMTACIACLLCCQDTVTSSKKAGINRLIITAIGGAVGVGAVLLDNVLGNEWAMAAMVAVGVLLTLFLCKMAKVPYINARIGGVTFILVSCTLAGNARIWYAVLRFISTLYGALVVLLVTWIFEYFQRKE